MNDDVSVVTNPKFRMWRRPDGIVQLVWVPRCTMALADAVAAVEAMTLLVRGDAAPLLVDARDTGPQDRSARGEFARRGELVSAIALLVGTPLSRMLGNFFIGVSRPIPPTRLFDDEDAAVSWLLESIR